MSYCWKAGEAAVTGPFHSFLFLQGNTCASAVRDTYESDALVSYEGGKAEGILRTL